MSHIFCRRASALLLLSLLLFSLFGCAAHDALGYQRRELAFTGTYTCGDLRFHGTLIQTPETKNAPRSLRFEIDDPGVFSGMRVSYDGKECRLSFGGLSRALPSPPPSFRALFSLFSVPDDAAVSRMRDAFCAVSSGTVWNVTLQSGMPAELHSGNAHFEVESVTLP